METKQERRFGKMAMQEFGKKLEHFSDTIAADFVGESELTVTITLHEYRELVHSVAISDAKIAEANNDKYDRNLENKQLKEENAELKQEIYELKKELEQSQPDTAANDAILIPTEDL